MIEIDEATTISFIWSDSISYLTPLKSGVDPWPDAKGITEQLYAQMVGFDEEVCTHGR